MKNVIRALMLIAVLATGLATVNAQSAGGEMKKSGTEAKTAGKSLGKNVKHGRVVRGGKEFGKHVGSSGKHVGKGVAKGVKKAVKPLLF